MKNQMASSLGLAKLLKQEVSLDTALREQEEACTELSTV